MYVHVLTNVYYIIISGRGGEGGIEILFDVAE